MESANKLISTQLYKFSDLLEANGDNPYRVRAYRRAAHTILNLKTDIVSLYNNNFDLTRLPWIGKGIANTIHFIIQTKKIPELQYKEKKKKINELMDIYGLGKKRIAILNQLNIKTKKDLLEAINSNKLQSLKWLNKKLENQIKSDIIHPKSRQFIRLYHAVPIVEILIKKLNKIKGVLHIENCGDFRRKKEILEKIDILILADNPSYILKEFSKFKEISHILQQTDHSMTVNLWAGIKACIYLVPETIFGIKLLFLTGSNKHLSALSHWAEEKKFSLTEEGLFKEDQCLAKANEAEIYQKLNLAYIEPELREGGNEIERAARKKLPHLIELKDIKGDLHSHTNETDGKETMEVMVNTAADHGYEYIAITDHSKNLAITNGLDEKRLLRQIAKIDRLNSKTNNNILILKSIEVDILEDGSLDLSNNVLKELDLVVGSIHSKFKFSEEKQTDRILRAMDNPYLNIVGHLTGRLIKSRDPYLIDIEKIFQAAKNRNCVIELNSQPYRLDINDVYCQLAKEMGVKIAISSDAHNTKELNYMQFGIFQARRGWLEKKDVINTYPWDQLKVLIKRF